MNRAAATSRGPGASRSAEEDIAAQQAPAHGRGPSPYRPPRLVTYGRLTDVTRFGGSQIVDSGSGLGQAPG
jgi:hypothetical protein